MWLIEQEDVALSQLVEVHGTGFSSRLLEQTIERLLRGCFQIIVDGSVLHFKMLVPNEQGSAGPGGGHGYAAGMAVNAEHP
ncbi:hypothetical protein [Methylobacterium sp. 10]|uniref:hypothetical protein n=1 Tax=Methylobacterium sp. 10 TaxID=1101191 RepID=UPI000480F21A|nr:hypothetical protein [Methylobacterium sp. 10]